MIHKASRKFWSLYQELPQEIREAADEAFHLLKANPRHPSLHFKKLGATQYWSARVTRSYRAVAIITEDVCLWFWIGTHSDYDKLLRGG